MPAPTATTLKKRKKSVLKRIRQTARHTARNRRNKVLLRRQIKQFRRALAAGNRAEAEQLLRPTISLIDRSIQKGILHPNTADRYKSRLMLHYNALHAQAATS
ncbi:MAG: 30S ribosomal protein S20 [Terriglobia bacterium]